MGQQQLLLLVLAVVIVGIAIVVGINLFAANAVESNRTALIADLNNLYQLTTVFKKTPTYFGGGGNSFIGFIIPTNLTSTPNGTFNISTPGSAFSITFDGVGKEIGNDGTTPIKYSGRVTPEKIIITQIN